MEAAEPEQVLERKKVSAGIWLAPLLAIVLLAFEFILHTQPSWYARYGFEIELPMWRNIGIVIMVLLIAGLIRVAMGRSGGTTVEGMSVRTSSEVFEPSEPVEVEPEYVDEEGVADDTEEKEGEAAEKTAEAPGKGYMPHLIEYPPKVTGGVYGDTIIPIGKASKLKLRTLIVRSCLLCDHQDKCWKDARGMMTREEFMANVECRDALKEVKASA